MMAKAEHGGVPPSDLQRIHERLDDLFAQSGEINTKLGRFEERCGPCQEHVHEHERALKGFNGTPGLVAEVSAIKQRGNRTDTLSVKSVLALLTGLGALAGALGAAIAAAVKAMFSGA